jgi:hypothetical protein
VVAPCDSLLRVSILPSKTNPVLEVVPDIDADSSNYAMLIQPLQREEQGKRTYQEENGC